MGSPYQNSRLEYATNKAADTYYYPPAGQEMCGNVCATVGLVLAGGATATIEATMQRGSGLDQESGVTQTWVDITKSFKDLSTALDGTASFADANKILQCNGLDVEAIRVKIVTSDATNTIGVWLRVL